MKGIVLLCILVGIGSSDNVPSSQFPEPTSKEIKYDYIVGLTQWMEEEERRVLLESLLNQHCKSSMPCQWSIVDRNNPASHSSSDFEVIQIRPVSAQKHVVNHLERYEKIAYVMKERIMRPRELSWSARDLSVQNEDSVAALVEAGQLWKEGYTGKGVRVAIFDTGLNKNDKNFRNIKDITNWTSERQSGDNVGHGTYVAGIVAGLHENCPGIAPDAELYIFRVFTSRQISYTSWFLDAFNHAIQSHVDILNLSTGGPDFLDMPFINKIREMSARGIIVVSAIGNDGPGFGTDNNPADMMDVIGVGGLSREGTLARFSSRGMTLHEIPEGYGRFKPDILAPSHTIQASWKDGRCRTLSGTSVASPVVVGSIALMIQAARDEGSASKVNPASIRQALMESARRLGKFSVFEQGAGALDLPQALHSLLDEPTHVSILPPEVNLHTCPYMWPYCAQPLYYSALPVIVNLTILSGIGERSEIVSSPHVEKDGDGVLRVRYVVEENYIFQIDCHYERTIWPWSGYFAISLRVRRPIESLEEFLRPVQALVSFDIMAKGHTRVHKVRIPILVRVAPTPPRNRRLLWDIAHSISYPHGFVPKDDLSSGDELDWRGDHPHTNFRQMFLQLRKSGYYVEVLGASFLCFDASNYGALMIIDPEDGFHPEEVAKLVHDVDVLGMGLVVVGGWFNSKTLDSLRFYDEGTQMWWNPITGGSNIPAINDLLEPWGIALGERIFTGYVDVYDIKFSVASGSSIVRFPKGGRLVQATLKDITEDVHGVSGPMVSSVGVVGLMSRRSEGGGHIAVITDSGCMDSAYSDRSVICRPVVRTLIEHASGRQVSSAWAHLPELQHSFVSLRTGIPSWVLPRDLLNASRTIGKEHPLPCPSTYPPFFVDNHLPGTPWMPAAVAKESTAPPLNPSKYLLVGVVWTLMVVLFCKLLRNRCRRMQLSKRSRSPPVPPV